MQLLFPDGCKNEGYWDAEESRCVGCSSSGIAFFHAGCSSGNKFVDVYFECETACGAPQEVDN